MISKKQMYEIICEQHKKIVLLQEQMKIALQNCNDFQCYRANMREANYKLGLRLDNMDDDIDDLYDKLNGVKYEE